MILVYDKNTHVYNTRNLPCVAAEDTAEEIGDTNIFIVYRCT